MFLCISVSLCDVLCVVCVCYVCVLLNVSVYFGVALCLYVMCPDCYCILVSSRCARFGVSLHVSVRVSLFIRVSLLCVSVSVFPFGFRV